MQAEFFKNLTPIQQKGRRVPITLQEKVDKEIDKLLEQGYNRWGGGGFFSRYNRWGGEEIVK